MSGRPLALVACGALAAEVRRLAAEGALPLEVHVLPPLLHDHPERIAPAVEQLARRLQEEGKEVVVGYADCGTYGALDATCASLGLRRLEGLHCYDVLAGPETVQRLLAEEPGTYLLTDFLVRSFRRTVVGELGLERHPELLADYFGNYRRIVWLSERPTPELAEEAAAIGLLLGLPLEQLATGTARLRTALRRLVSPEEAA